MEHSQSNDTPAEQDITFSNYEEPVKIVEKTYNFLIGSLAYIISGTRLDTSDLSESNIKKLYRKFRYLKRTTEFGSEYTEGEMTKIACCVNASWANGNDKKSISGLCF